MPSTNSGPAATVTPNYVSQSAPAGSASVPFDPSNVNIGGGSIGGASVAAVAANSSANAIVLDNAANGATTGWLPSAVASERWGFKLLSGASAGIAVDGSNDGTTYAGQVATVTLDTTGKTFISAPIKPLYPFIRFTITSGTGLAQIARGM